MKLKDILLHLKPFYKGRIDLVFKKQNQELMKILEKDISTMRGSEYFIAVSSISEDFENDTENILQEIANGKKRAFLKRMEKKEFTYSHSNIFQKFISQFVTHQKDIARNAFISESRMSKILMQAHEDFYAYEIYAIAKSQNIKLQTAFDQLYSEKAIKDFNGEKNHKRVVK